MKKLVISGVNIFEGGTLSIYKDCLDNLLNLKINDDYHITIFVHDKNMFSSFEEYFQIIELKKSRSSYFFRLFYEYIYFFLYSINKNIDVWFSIHDMTPNVIAKKRYVYCHNSSPFYKMTEKEAIYEPKLRLFNLFYKYVYKINIKRNTGVIVQQHWIKDEFERAFGINNLIVSYPDVNKNQLDLTTASHVSGSSNEVIFFYPSFPRVFKNFEVICEAAKVLKNRGYSGFRIYLTLDGSENKYTKDIVNSFSDIENLEFIGLIKRVDVYKYYEKADFLIFPSRLETWGLPITEFKEFNKPIILADLPYAIETIGKYDKVKFFDPDNSNILADIMEKCINNSIEWTNTIPQKEPDTDSWETLIRRLLF